MGLGTIYLLCFAGVVLFSSQAIGAFMTPLYTYSFHTYSLHCS